MRNTIDSYKTRAGRLDLDGLDFEAFRDQPLSADGVRCLCYMHDIEHHTVCYLRDLLLTPAHRDPDITAFLSCWGFEEFWHGEAMAAVLEAHGEPAGRQRIAPLRQKRKWKDSATLLGTAAGSALAGRQFIAVHMSWGAVNEWVTQAAYGLLAQREGHPVLSELLDRVMRQEGRHIAFYASEAARRLEADAGAQRLTRFALRHAWEPVGAGVMPRHEVEFMCRYLFSGPDGAEATARIDRHVDQLPGLSGLGLMTRAVERYSAPAR